MNTKKTRWGRPMAALFVLCLTTGAFAEDGAARRPALWRETGSDFDGRVVRLSIDAAAVSAAAAQSELVLGPVMLPGGIQGDLELRRVEAFAPGARIVTVSAQGERELPRPAMANFRGTAAGRADSFVFLSVGPHGVMGWIEFGGETLMVSTDPADHSVAAIFRPADLPAGAIKLAPFACAADRLAIPPRRAPAPMMGNGLGRGGARATCRSADLAIDTDYEYLELFAGDTGAASAYTAALVGAISEIYVRDINASLAISYLRLWETPADPWNQGNTIDQLYQFQDYWNLNMTGEIRSAAHFLSGRALGGGVAYLEALCYPEYDYGLSANMNGFFPYPVQHNNAQNWDLMVMSHELGHNFGAPHTHDMSPPVDNCASGDCSVVPNGTIMSYCHLCSGGLANVRMELHTRTVYETIIPFLDVLAECDLTTPCLPVGDCNGDGAMDLADVDCFVSVALGVNTYYGPIQRCDVDESGAVNGLDTPLFLGALGL